MDMVVSDIALLERWRSIKDAEAFNEIVSRYGDLVYATCRWSRPRADKSIYRAVSISSK